MRRKARICAGCVRPCTDSGPPTRYARRALLRAAVFDNPVSTAASTNSGQRPPGRHGRTGVRPRAAPARAVMTGTVLTAARVPRSSRADGDTGWCCRPPTASAGPARPSPPPWQPAATACWSGCCPASRHAAERIWARLGRVTGRDRAGRGRELLVDTRAARPRARAGRDPRRRRAGHVQVRFPRLDARLPDRRHRHPPRRRLPAGGHARHRAAALPRRPPAPAPPPAGAYHGGPISGVGGLARARRRAGRPARARLPRPRPGDRGPGRRAAHQHGPSCPRCRTCRSAACCGISNECAEPGGGAAGHQLQRRRAPVLRPVREVRHLPPGHGWRT